MIENSLQLKDTDPLLGNSLNISFPMQTLSPEKAFHQLQISLLSKNDSVRSTKVGYLLNNLNENCNSKLHSFLYVPNRNLPFLLTLEDPLNKPESIFGTISGVQYSLPFLCNIAHKIEGSWRKPEQYTHYLLELIKSKTFERTRHSSDFSLKHYLHNTPEIEDVSEISNYGVSK
jgi:hypothetical protein